MHVDRRFVHIFESGMMIPNAAFFPATKSYVKEGNRRLNAYHHGHCIYSD